MEIKEFNDILKNASSGAEFKAHLKEKNMTIVDKLHISKAKDKFWLCYDDGPSGEHSPHKHGYVKSWVVVNDNCSGIEIELLNKEPKVIDNYEIF